MDRRLNPYVPGAGLQPRELAGRDELLKEANIDMERVMGGRPVRGLMLLGLRGVGKTVLLVRLKESAEKKGFKVGKIEAPENGALPRLLAPELRKILYALDLKASAAQSVRDAAAALRNFVAVFNVKIGDVEFGLKPSPGVADTGDLTQDLPDLLVAVAQAAADRRSAVAIFIDEVQYLSLQELTAVVVACHEISQRNLPLVLVGAGLPQIAALAGNAKSYAERLFTYKKIDQLDEEAARDALTKPAKGSGVRFDKGAVDEILRITERYPYFIQEWGSHVWDAAPKSPITKKDVEDVHAAVIGQLDESFFRVRFNRLTELEQKYLRAMAELGAGAQRTGAIAEMLGVGAANVGPIRQHLIDKGMIWSPRHGQTSFTVPMFDQFMKREMPKLEKHKPKREAVTKAKSKAATAKSSKRGS